MSSWNEDDLRAIAESHDLYISPFREDGITYGTPTLVWPLVVDGEVYVRAANGQQPSWYVAAMNQKAGRIHIGGKDHEVTFEPGGNTVASAIDAAYEENTRAAQPCRSCREKGRSQRPCGSRHVERLSEFPKLIGSGSHLGSQRAGLSQPAADEGERVEA